MDGQEADPFALQLATTTPAQERPNGKGTRNRRADEPLAQWFGFVSWISLFGLPLTCVLPGSSRRW